MSAIMRPYSALFTGPESLRSLSFLTLGGGSEMRAVQVGETSGDGTTEERAEHEGVDVVLVNAILIVEVSGLVSSKSESDSRVEASTELATGLNAAKEDEADSKGTSGAISRRGDNTTSLDHEDHADENCRENCLIHKHLGVYKEALLSVSAITDGLCGPVGVCWVLRAKDLDITIGDLTELLAEEGGLTETPSEAGTEDLGDPEDSDPAEVGQELAFADVDSKGHCRVEVAACDSSEDHDACEEREGESYRVIRHHDAVDKEGSAQHLVNEHSSFS